MAAPLAHRVALARRLDFDHLGAEVSQKLAAEGSGEKAAHLDDAQPFERAPAV
nr:hypothetical protein [Rubrobacter tropicus]